MQTCPKCKNQTLKHLHDSAYGIEGTHMAGTERFECDCGFSCWDAIDGEEFGLTFVLDEIDENEKELRELDI
jgi:hypothetical protein